MCPQETFIRKGTQLDGVTTTLILLGTDTIVGMRYENPPSLNGYGDMKGRFKVSVSVKQILAAAIINNARTCKLANAYSTVENDYHANL